MGNLFIPDTFKLDDKLLVLVMELPILGGMRPSVVPWCDPR